MGSRSVLDGQLIYALAAHNILVAVSGFVDITRTSHPGLLSPPDSFSSSISDRDEGKVRGGDLVQPD